MDRMIDVDPQSHDRDGRSGHLRARARKGTAGARDSRSATIRNRSSFPRLGGWIAHRGAGQGSNRYGRAEDWLVGAKLATPRGSCSRPADFPASFDGPASERSRARIGRHVRHRHRSDVRICSPRQRRATIAAICSAISQAVSRPSARRRSKRSPLTMLRLSDAEETQFYRAFGALGKKRGIRRLDSHRFLSATRAASTTRPCALIAGFRRRTREEAAAAHKRFDALAKKYGALSLGAGQGKRWKEGRFHGPYLRDPMMDRGVGVDTLETATSWSKIGRLYVAVRDGAGNAIRETAPRAARAAS